MRIRLRAPRANGPRVIPFIPDVRLCHLEGRNGIGKTLAVRLLELATGGQPFRATPAAWQALCDQLGPVFIDVDHLDGGLTLHFELTPDDWPRVPQAIHQSDRLGSVLINGTPASLEEARRRLRIFRIGGEETLRQTVGSELAVRAARARRFAVALRPRAAAWDEALNPFAELTQGLTEEALEAAGSYVIETQAELDLANSAADDTRQLSEATTTALEQLDAAARLLDSGDQLIEALFQSESRLKELEEGITEAETEAVQAAAAAVGHAEARQRLTAAEELRTSRDHRLRKARVEEQRLLTLLELERRPPPPERRELRSETQREQATLQAQLDELDLITPLQTLTADLEWPLSRAAPALATQTVVAEPPLSVHDLLAGVRVRRRQLLGQPRPEEVERLRRLLGTLRETIRLLDELENAAANTDRKAKLVDDSVAEIQNLLATVAGSDASRYRSAHERLQILRDEQIELEVSAAEGRRDLAELFAAAKLDLSLEAVSANGLPVADVVDSATSAVAAAIAVDPTGETVPPGLREAVAARGSLGDLRSAVVEWAAAVQARELVTTAAAQDARSAVEDAQNSFLNIRRRLREAIGQFVKATAGLRHAIDGFVSDRNWQNTQRLRESLGALSDAPDEEAFGAVSDAERVAAAVSSRVFRAANGLAAAAARVTDVSESLVAYLLQQTSRLEPAEAPQDLPPLQRIVSEKGFRRWVEAELEALFSNPELLRDLFDGTDRIRFDLSDLVIRWSDQEGRLRRRPLEAFSSGEQAFAYTRARLDALKADVVGVDHVLVVLDEFGAFVARDRLSHLLRFVEQEALAGLAEQAVVMLPLAQDYEDLPEPRPELEGPDPSLPEDVQIATWGYFCRDALVSAKA